MCRAFIGRSKGPVFGCWLLYNNNNKKLSKLYLTKSEFHTFISCNLSNMLIIDARQNNSLINRIILTEEFLLFVGLLKTFIKPHKYEL